MAFYVIFCLINFSDFILTLLKVVYFDQLLGAVLCQVLYIPISSSVLLVLCLIFFHDSLTKRVCSLICARSAHYNSVDKVKVGQCDIKV